jgi:peptidyl-prolyl cis-trans isomerase A (cyclophilin A)
LQKLRFLSFLFCVALSAQTVRFNTIGGSMDVVLTPDIAPKTVANFLNYVNSGAYNSTIVHRSIPGFVIQGGGYVVKNHLPFLFPPNDPVANEYKTSNTRGTIAMALQGSDINSAQDQWFFNLGDNSSTLDSQSFTVFGSVADDAGLAVMDTLAGIPTFTFNGLSNFPLFNYTAGRTVADTNFVYVNSIVQLPAAVNAATFNANLSSGISPGEILTLFGRGMGPDQLTTLTVNSAGKVDTTLAGTQVLFNGVPGPMIFTSSGQVAVVAPYSIAGLGTVSVTVSYNGTQTTPIQFNVVPANPGLFTLNNSGKGDAAIVRLDGSVVGTASPASVGDTVELYGEGYGVVSPGLPDGAVVTGPLNVPATLLIDSKQVDTLYAGGAGGDVNGVLQVNFKVPQLTPGSHQIQVKVGNATSPTGVTIQTK